MTRIHYKGRQIFLTFLILSLIGSILNSPSLKNLEPMDGNNLISFANASPSNCLNTTVHSGDLIIQQNEIIVIRDAKYIVEGNIQIYGNLTVENSELLIKYDSSYYRYLRCYSSGNLTAINSTIGYENAPEWYSARWYDEGTICFRNATSPKVEWYIYGYSRFFSIRNSTIYRVVFRIDMNSNSSLLIESGFIIADAIINVDLPFIDFPENNIVEDQVVFEIWAHDYSNLTIINTREIFNFNGWIEIYIYDSSHVYIENSEIGFATVDISVLSDGYLFIDNETVVESVNVKYPTVILTNTTIKAYFQTSIYCHSNSSLKVTNVYGTWENHRPWYISLYDGFREAKINDSEIEHVYIGSYSGGNLYVYNSTISSIDTPWGTSANSTIFLRKAYVDWMYLHGLSSMVCDNSTVGTLNMYDNSSAILNNYTTVRCFVSCFDVSDNCYIVVNGSQIVSNGTANPQIFCDETSKIQQQEIAIYLHNNASGTLINANINDVYCYDHNKLNATNTRINYVHIDSDGVLYFENCTILSGFSVSSYVDARVWLLNSTVNSLSTWGDSWANLTLFVKHSHIDWLRLYGNSYLFAENSTLMNVYLDHNVSDEIYYTNSQYIRLEQNSSLILGPYCSVTELDVFLTVYGYIFMNGSSIYMENAAGPSLQVSGNVQISFMEMDIFLYYNALAELYNTSIHGIYCYDNSTVDISNTRINFVNLYGNSQGVITSSTVYDDISLYENSSMVITDSTCNTIHCYDSSMLNATNTSVAYMAMYEDASVSFVDSSVDNLFCYGQSRLKFDFSDGEYVHLNDGSSLSACNSTFDSVYSYSGTSAYLKNSVVNYLYADSNVSITLFDTFVSSPNYSDPSSVEIIDTQSPVILSISYYPSFPSETDAITFTVQIRDMAVAEVILLYSVNNGSWVQVSMVETSSNTFSATIGPFPANSTLFYKIVAQDQDGRETESSVHMLYIKGSSVSGEPSGEEGGESAGVSPGGVRPSGNLLSTLFSVILLLIFSLFSTALYTAIRSRAATVMEKVVKPRLAEEETPFREIVDMVSNGDYEGAYNIIRSVENVDEILSEIPSSIRVGFSSWLLNRFLEDGFYDKAVDIASKMRDMRRLRAIYLGIAMKELAEGDKKEAIGFFEKAIEVSERMGDKKSAKAIRKSLGKIY